MRPYLISGVLGIVSRYPILNPQTSKMDLLLIEQLEQEQESAEQGPIEVKIPIHTCFQASKNIQKEKGKESFPISVGIWWIYTLS